MFRIVSGHRRAPNGRARIGGPRFSGGAKYASWLAAAFARQGREVAGIHLAGINQNTLVDAASQFNVLNAAFKRVPVFLQVGDKDDVSTPADHQALASELRRAGFRNVRLESFAGTHEVEPAPLRAALEWFRLFFATRKRNGGRSRARSRRPDGFAVGLRLRSRPKQTGRPRAPLAGERRRVNIGPRAPPAAPRSRRRGCRCRPS